MLLTCCFREPKTKNHKKHNIIQENEEFLPLSLPQPSPVVTVHRPTRRSINGQDRKLEKYPPSKEEKRLIKQRSQESLHRQSIIYETSQSQQSNIIITDQSNVGHCDKETLTNISSIKCIEEYLPSPPATPKINSKYRGQSLPETPTLSVSILQETSTQGSNSDKHKDDSIYTSTPASAGGSSSSSSTSVTQSQTSIVTTRAACLEGGMDRSSYFLNAELPKEQVKEKEESDKLQKHKNVIDEVRREHDHIMQKLKKGNELELEKARETFDSTLQLEISHYIQDNTGLILRTKSEANETITKLNQQIVLERAKMIAEQQENFKNLKVEYKMKEERLNESMHQIQERDQAWQEDKADVVKEVQRLKAEATRMVKILAMEYKEENLSEDKKKSLNQEVYSLQLVVEMRTGERRNLREQMARATQKLEQEEFVKEKLRKATARMEDLEEQIKIKSHFERQLSLEKSQLEMKMTNSTKAAQRMSQNVEELQWRFKNNLELPVQYFEKQHIENHQPRSSQGFSETLEKTITTPVPIIEAESTTKQRSCFTVSPEMLQAISYDIYDDNGATSDISPSSDIVIEYMIVGDAEEDLVENEHNRDSDKLDGNSHDEGLGDISSDEINESIAHNSEIIVTHKYYNNDNETCEKAIIMSAKSSDKYFMKNNENDRNLCQPIKNEKERRPSRIAYETPL